MKKIRVLSGIMAVTLMLLVVSGAFADLNLKKGSSGNYVREMQQKMMSHRVQMLRSLLNAFMGNHINCNNVNAKITLRNYFVNIYMLVIIDKDKNMANHRMIRELDEHLKKLSPSMYTFIGDYAVNVFGWKYKVIDHWRKHKLMNLHLLHQLIRLDNARLAISYKFKTFLQLRRK